MLSRVIVVTSLIKKASLPRNDLKNYRHVSNLCFLSKVAERVVAKQLISHINNNKLDNPHQSAYKPGYSTESALLSIKNFLSLSCQYSWKHFSSHKKASAALAKLNAGLQGVQLWMLSVN